MDSSNYISSQMEQARNSFDIQGLDALRQGAKKGERAALEETAKQFEAIFVNMMLKSMRAAEDVLADEKSPFNSQQVKFYRGMHDQQLASDIATNGNIGLAEAIVRQLDPQGSGVMPASALRNDATLDGPRFRQSINLQEVENAIGAAIDSKTKDNGLITTPGQPVKMAAFGSPEEFVSSLLPIAEQVSKEIGLDPKAMVAQAAVETGWGQHMIHSGAGENSHNLFGVKASRGWDGDKNYVDTLEFKDGTAHKTKAPFRSYNSFAESMQDYVDFLKSSPRYQNALEQTNDSQQYFKALQNSGYATDPKYAEKVMSVLNSDRMKNTALGEGV